MFLFLCYFLLAADVFHEEHSQEKFIRLLEGRFLTLDEPLFDEKDGSIRLERVELEFFDSFNKEFTQEKTSWSYFLNFNTNLLANPKYFKLVESLYEDLLIIESEVLQEEDQIVSYNYTDSEKMFLKYHLNDENTLSNQEIPLDENSDEASFDPILSKERLRELAKPLGFDEEEIEFLSNIGYYRKLITYLDKIIIDLSPFHIASLEEEILRFNERFHGFLFVRFHMNEKSKKRIFSSLCIRYENKRHLKVVEMEPYSSSNRNIVKDPSVVKSNQKLLRFCQGSNNFYTYFCKHGLPRYRHLFLIGIPILLFSFVLKIAFYRFV